MSEEGAYMIFCTELYRREKNLTGKQVADLFSRYNVYDYIRKYFGAFHTMGEKLVFDDIDAYIARQGARAPVSWLPVNRCLIYKIRSDLIL